MGSLPDLLERPSPQLQPLFHGTTPEETQVRFIPNIHDKSFSHVRLDNIVKRPVKECIP